MLFMKKNNPIFIVLLFFCFNTNAFSADCSNIDDEQELFNCEKQNLNTYIKQLNNSVNLIVDKLDSQKEHYVVDRAKYFSESQKHWENTTEAFCNYVASSETGNMKDIKSFLC